jgi:hypothetical protein
VLIYLLCVHSVLREIEENKNVREPQKPVKPKAPETPVKTETAEPPAAPTKTSTNHGRGGSAAFY